MAKLLKKRPAATLRRNKENQPPVAKRKAANRPPKLRTWTNESMLEAMAAVKEGKMGVNRAALEHGVPRTTLKDRLAGRVTHGDNFGPKPYLTQEEEKELVKFLIDCCKMGYGKTRGEVLKIVEAVVRKKGRKLKGPISQGWWCRFCERWPELSLRKGDSFSVAREKMTSREVMNNYFDLLEETLDKYGLKDKPSQIYNCDETGMPLEHKLPRVVSTKGTKKVRQISSGNKTQITVLGCCNATGQTIPPLVVFAGKKFNHALSEGELPGTLYSMSDSGWMDQELFADWFENHFLKHAVTARPLMLMLDGHSSHYTLDLVKTAAENDVVIFCLPPHTTADSQPLDTSCFGPLKVHWTQACREYMFANPGRVVSKFQFSRLFAQAWSKGMCIDNIISGFRSTGIYPFNRDAILSKLPASADSPHCDDDAEEEPERPCDSDSDPIDEADLQDDSTQNEDPIHLETSTDHSLEGVSPGSCIPLPFDGNPPAEFVDPPVFSPEKVALFERRLENGYDVYTDTDYVTWLQTFHPESAPPLSAVFSSVQPLQTNNRLANSCDPVASSSSGGEFDQPSVLTQVPSTPTGRPSRVCRTVPPKQSLYPNSSPSDASPEVNSNFNSSTPSSSKSSSPTVCSASSINSLSSSGSPLATRIAPSSQTSSSPISEFLVYPTPVTKSKPKDIARSARVLTSAESLAMLEEKERKKKEEEEEKARKKKEREDKRLAREEEKKKKAEEREAKKALLQAKKAELEAKKAEKKAEQARKSAQQKEGSVGECSNRKRRLPEGPLKTYPKRKRVEGASVVARQDVQDSCYVCTGLYSDDLDENSCVIDGHDWIQCSEGVCGVWSHVQCLEKAIGGFICAACQNVFC